MRIFALLPLLVLFGGYTWTPAHVIPQETSVKKPSLTADQLDRARIIFNGKCSRCHGTNGRGHTALGDMLDVPDFTNESWWNDHNDTDALVDTIKNGNGGMPAFGKKLTKAEISLLANYVRYFNQDEP